MRDLAMNRLRLSALRCLSTVAVAIPFCAPSPVQAQDLFGFLRLLFQPTVRVPLSPSHNYRAPLRRPHVVRADQLSSKPPLKPKPLGEITNPVPELLGDRTLRRGDFVMFPDGLRVFRGQSGTQHTLADFEPVPGDLKAMPPATRKLVAGLRPGWIGAWAAEGKVSSGQLVARDADITGSITRPRRSQTAE